MKNELWSQWSDCHNSSDQQTRLASAKKSSCTPSSVDFTELSGVFKGSSGTHSTSLQQCTCVDFKRRRLPCKHMYRLAMELGCLNVDFSSDIRDVAVPKKEHMNLSGAIDLIEQLSNDSQQLLLKSIRHLSKEKPFFCLPKSSDFNKLFEAAMIFEATDPETHLQYYSRNELNNRIATLNIPFKKNMSLQNLISWCIENIPNHIDSLCDDSMVVKFSTHVRPKKIHQYLHRKFDVEPAFILESNTIEDVPILYTLLPDDDITEELIKRGYYVK